VNSNVTGTTNGYNDGVANGSLLNVTAPSTSNASASASLLAEFIEAYKELSSYRYV
jgi:hypothetical protein